MTQITVPPGVKSTGLLSLDLRLGGRIPDGTIVEIFGEQSTGRTALALNCILNAQHAGLRTAIVDANNNFETARAYDFGIDLDQLWWKFPTCLEDVFQSLLVAANEMDLIVLDDLASQPKSDDNDMLDVKQYRRTVSDGLRQLSHKLRHTNATVVVVNQTRAQIGGFGLRSYFGDLISMYAGRVIKMMEGPAARDKHIRVGRYIDAKVAKVYGVQPYGLTRIRMEWDGFDEVGDVLDLALQHGLLERRGPNLFCLIDETNLGVSYKQIRQTLDDKPQVWEGIETAVRKRYDL